MDLRWLWASAGGAVTTGLVVMANAIVGNLVGLNLFTITVFFVIPMGAIFCGAAAAYGFFFVSHKVHLKPAPWMVLPLLVFGAMAFFGTHFAEYFTLSVQGQRVADAMSFERYLSLVTGAQTLRVGRGGTAELPISEDIGFWLSVLHFVGFSIGATWVYPALSQARACLSCRKYLRASGQRNRYFGSRDEGAWFYDNVLDLPVDGEHFAEAMRLGSKKPLKDPSGLHIESRLYDCEDCHRQLWTDKVSAWDGREWRLVPSLERATVVSPELHVARYFERRSLPFF